MIAIVRANVQREPTITHIVAQWLASPLAVSLTSLSLSKNYQEDETDYFDLVALFI